MDLALVGEVFFCGDRVGASVAAVALRGLAEVGLESGVRGSENQKAISIWMGLTSLSFGIRIVRIWSREERTALLGESAVA